MSQRSRPELVPKWLALWFVPRRHPRISSVRLTSSNTMQRSQLPIFLEPCDKLLPGEPSTEPVDYHSALFKHIRVPSVAHVLWWPSESEGKACMIFIPGEGL